MGDSLKKLLVVPALSETTPSSSKSINQSKYYSSMASKPINIRRIKTGSKQSWKIMSSIVLQTVFHEY